MSWAAQGQEVVEGGGRHRTLGRVLGQSGDGVVYELDGAPGPLAKIFHQPLSFDRTEKIRVMVATRTPALERWTGWPLDLLFLPDGRPIGLKMPLMTERRDLRHLFDPRNRVAAFPHADWRFLVQVAANIAHAFATVHASGGAIANVDPGGVLVGQDAHIRLVDCDNFQVVTGGKLFPGGVGNSVFTAPELQGQSLSGFMRTENHDNFGLAVMIFLVLFMGRHPYDGLWQGSDEMPIERAIKEHRFAYGRNRDLAGMEQPPGTPPLDIVSDLAVQLFERAFSPSATRGGRPTAVEWVVALEALSANLVECPVDIRHWYTDGLAECPWCRVETASSGSLFSSAPPAATPEVFDLRTFWNQVAAVEHPGPAPNLTIGIEEPKPASVARRFVRRRALHGSVALVVAVVPAAVGFGIDLPVIGRGLLFIAAIVLYALVRLGLRAKASETPFVLREQECRKRWETALADWQAKASPLGFEEKRLELERLKRWWDEVSARPQQRARIEAAIRRAFNDLQRVAHEIQSARATLYEEAREAYRRLLQAQADLETVRQRRG